jgi:hypothetical protein
MIDPSPYILAFFGWITLCAVHSLGRKANFDAARSMEDSYAKAIDSAPTEEARSLAIASRALIRASRDKSLAIVESRYEAAMDQARSLPEMMAVAADREQWRLATPRPPTEDAF